MENRNSSLNGRTTRILLTACAAAAFAVALALPKAAYADDVTLPPMPMAVQVTNGDIPFLVGHAIGTQNYVCLPSGSGVAFVLFTPEATLSDDEDEQIITHFFSPNPSEPNTNPALSATGTIRATWQSSRDTSSVWALAKPGDSATFVTDPGFVAPNSVAWLKLTAVGNGIGPNGGDKLADVTFVQRLSTHGGVAPATGCTSSADIGHLAFVPYTADYFFYRHPGNQGHRN
jgi:Protein of unknown function (DUF3455)